MFANLFLKLAHFFEDHFQLSIFSVAADGFPQDFVFTIRLVLFWFRNYQRRPFDDFMGIPAVPPTLCEFTYMAGRENDSPGFPSIRLPGVCADAPVLIHDPGFLIERGRERILNADPLRTLEHICGRNQQIIIQFLPHPFITPHVLEMVNDLV